MNVKVLRLAAVLFGLFPGLAAAEPITLKLSFFTSDRANVYQCQVKPFVDAVNAEGGDLVQIKVYFSGGISRVLADQPKLVLDGTADLAIVVPGLSRRFFPDSSVMELPGLYRNEREASLIFTRLVAAGALEGYKDFFVVGAYVSAGESINSRKPIARLADLKGQSFRVNNRIEGDALRMLGAKPLLLPVNKTMEALSKGEIDGVTVPPAMLFEFGFARLTANHYLLQLGGAPIALVMNRQKFAGLPPRAQEIIRKFSGAWMAEQETACFGEKNRKAVARLKADSRRKVVEPSAADLEAARKVFASVIEQWAAESPRHRELLDLVRSEIAKLPRAK
jgi:TRAP-type C4-dicarboxylate transport system substrate-binding protein